MTVFQPNSLNEALELLNGHPEATLLSGGTDLMVGVNFGRFRPSAVVSLNRIDSLKGCELIDGGATLRIGSGVTYAALMASEVASLAPALVEAARTVGSPQIRNAATIGGNLGTCSPAGDTLPVLSALGADIEIASIGGTRLVAFDDFMVGPKRSCLEAGECVIAVRVPVRSGWQGFAKVGTRNAMVIAICNVAFVADRNSERVTLGLGSVGPTILNAPDASKWIETRIDWQDWTCLASPDEILTEFRPLVSSAARPIDDHRSTAHYRAHAVGVLASRLLSRAFQPEVREQLHG